MYSFNSCLLTLDRFLVNLMIGKHSEISLLATSSPEAVLKFSGRNHGRTLRFLRGAEVHGLLSIRCSILVFIM